MQSQVRDTDVILSQIARCETNKGTQKFLKRIQISKLKFQGLPDTSSGKKEKLRIIKWQRKQVTSKGGKFWIRNDGFWKEASDKVVIRAIAHKLIDRSMPATLQTRDPGDNSKRAKEKIEICNADVVLGCGKDFDHHKGNKTFVVEISKYRPLYKSLPQTNTGMEEKKQLVQDLEAGVAANGGRFLTLKRGEWIKVKQTVVKSKISEWLEAE